MSLYAETADKAKNKLEFHRRVSLNANNKISTNNNSLINNEMESTKSKHNNELDAKLIEITKIFVFVLDLLLFIINLAQWIINKSFVFFFGIFFVLFVWFCKIIAKKTNSSVFE